VTVTWRAAGSFRAPGAGPAYRVGGRRGSRHGRNPAVDRAASIAGHPAHRAEAGRARREQAARSRQRWPAGPVRFEVTEEASPGCDAVRYSCTPSLGTFSAVISANGDVLIPEGRLRAAMTLALGVRISRVHRPRPLSAVPAGAPGPAESRPDSGSGRSLADGNGPVTGSAGLRDLHAARHPALRRLARGRTLAAARQPWDDELEPFRHAAAGAPVRWLHATG